MASLNLPAETPTTNTTTQKPKTYKNPFISPLTKNPYVNPNLTYPKPRTVSNVIDSHYSSTHPGGGGGGGGVNREDGDQDMPPSKRSRSDGHKVPLSVPLSLTFEHLPGDRAGNLAAIQELAKGYDTSKPFGTSSFSLPSPPDSSVPTSPVKQEYHPVLKENSRPQHPPSDEAAELHDEDYVEAGDDSLMDIKD